jgi:toxin ParE1/3/4
MLDLIISPDARQDQIEILDYLAQEAGVDIAEKVFQAMEKAFGDLLVMPGLGVSPLFGAQFPNLRMWPVPKYRKYLIFYRATEINLEIVRILHGARDIERILGDR